jgi:7-cyano-7-deazaguanine synthase
MNNYQALVLLSGGQDSATCLALALKEYPEQVESIAFDYGQRHRIELNKAKKLASLANVKLTIINLKTLSELTENALTRKSINIEAKKDSLPSTFVDGRNLIFLSYAAIYAKSKGIKNIYTGVCQTDYSGYPDCREGFIKSLNNTLNLAMDYQFHIITPLMQLKKSETTKLMQKLGKLSWYKHTYTCYTGQKISCSQCPACLLRLKGFKEAGITDPIEY